MCMVTEPTWGESPVLSCQFSSEDFIGRAQLTVTKDPLVGMKAYTLLEPGLPPSQQK